MLNERRMKRNAKIFALFFMQYTFLMPVMHFVNATLVVGAFSVCLLFSLLFTNSRAAINWTIMRSFFLLLLLFVLKTALGQAEVATIAYVTLFTLPAMSLFLFPFDYSVCLDLLIRIARISFFAVAWIPFFFYDSYMRFGYGMLPIIMLMYVDLMYKRRKEPDGKRDSLRLLDFGIFFIGFAEMSLYGARGCLISLILFLAVDRLLINRKQIIQNLILIILAITVVGNIVPILGFAEQVSKKIGIYSYSIAKYKMQLSEGFEYASSGRMLIYSRAIEDIRANPIFGGYVDMNEEGGDYAHNLFLQIGQDFGVLAIIILAIFLFHTLYRIGQNRGSFDEKMLLVLLFSTSVGRLLFSSTLWRRPEFWMLVAMMILFKRNRYYNDKMSIPTFLVGNRLL